MMINEHEIFILAWLSSMHGKCYLPMPWIPSRIYNKLPIMLAYCDLPTEKRVSYWLSIWLKRETIQRTNESEMSSDNFRTSAFLFPSTHPPKQLLCGRGSSVCGMKCMTSLINHDTLLGNNNKFYVYYSRMGNSKWIIKANKVHTPKSLLPKPPPNYQW